VHVIVAEIVAKPGAADRYEALLRDIIAFVATADCFIQFNVHRGGPRNETFMLYEIWTNAVAYAQLREHARFQEYLKDRAQLVEPGLRRAEWTLLASFGGSEKRGQTRQAE
jgi:quinol monooxygenase YgiN